jgi:hypothetical protein
MKLTGEIRSTRGGGGTCPSATLSIKNSARTDLKSNPGLRGERPATNRLSHGTARNCLNCHNLFSPQNNWPVVRALIAKTSSRVQQQQRLCLR